MGSHRTRRSTPYRTPHQRLFAAKNTPNQVMCPTRHARTHAHTHARTHARTQVRPGHLTRPPPLSSVLPTLKLGAVLGARNVISFGERRGEERGGEGRRGARLPTRMTQSAVHPVPLFQTSLQPTHPPTTTPTLTSTATPALTTPHFTHTHTHTSFNTSPHTPRHATSCRHGPVRQHHVHPAGVGLPGLLRGHPPGGGVGVCVGGGGLAGGRLNRSTCCGNVFCVYVRWGAVGCGGVRWGAVGCGGVGWSGVGWGGLGWGGWGGMGACALASPSPCSSAPAIAPA